MALFSDLLPLIIPEVSNCPDIVVESHAVRAARELCRESKVWKLYAQMNVVANQPSYDLAAALTLPADSEIVMVETVSQGGTPLQGVDVIDMDNSVVGWRNQSAPTAINYVMTSPRALMLYPSPDATATVPLDITVTLRPTLAAKVMDNNLYSDYAEAIAYGAMYGLMTMGNKPWSDLNEAANKRDQFNYWVERATQSAARGFADLPIIITTE